MNDDLFARLRDGDPCAAREIEERYRGPLVRYAYRFLGDSASAEDAAQDVLVRALALEAPPERLRPWLYRALRNLCLNQRRDLRRRGVAGLDGASGLAESHTGHLSRLVRAEQRAALAELLASMPEAQREVLDLRYGEDLGREEIAEVLGLDLSVVKSRLYEGMQRLRARAGHLAPDPDRPR